MKVRPMGSLMRSAGWLVLLPALAGGAESARAQDMINRTCPVMTEELADPDITVTYEGKKVAFCCDNCVKKFNRDPEKYLARLPQFGGRGELIAAADARAARPTDADAPDAHGSVADDADADTPDADAPEMSLFGRLHPAIVHFPIAALPLALIAWALYTWTGKEAFALADVPPLVVAALAATCAYFSGGAAEEGSRWSGELAEIVERHETCGTIVFVTSLVLVVLRVWKLRRLAGAWRWIYGAILAGACGLVGYTGFLGGSLVFGPDHLRF